jgi:hypothetical protein
MTSSSPMAEGTANDLVSTGTAMLANRHNKWLPVPSSTTLAVWSTSAALTADEG